MNFLNTATFSKGVKCVFGFSGKCFCVSRNDLNRIPMEGLGLKPLIIHSLSNKDVQIQTSIVIDNKVLLDLFQIFYDLQAQRGKCSPSLIALLLFDIILNAEDQNNEFDNPYQKLHSILFNQILNYFFPRPNLEVLPNFKCPHTLWPISGIVNRFCRLFTISLIWFML